jgi:hypothetical protein
MHPVPEQTDARAVIGIEYSTTSSGLFAPSLLWIAVPSVPVRVRTYVIGLSGVSSGTETLF